MAIFAELIATTPVAHGDPGASNKSNVAPFRMQEVLFARPTQTPVALDVEEEDTPIGSEPEHLRTRSLYEAEAALIRFATTFPLPADSLILDALGQLTAEQFVASAFVFALISQLNSMNGGDGAGLFEGKGRYDMLLKRLGIVAAQFNTSFFTLYSSLLTQLHIPEALPGMVDLFSQFAGLPRGVQQASIAILGKERQSVLMIARAWFDAVREVRKRSPDWERFESVYYDPTDKIAGTSVQDAEAAIPHISTNAFRHTIFRETLCEHLLQACALGSVADVSQQKRLPKFVIQLLSNGGNVEGGASVPDNSEAINMAIKTTFPSLELLSGCVPTHIMGPGMLLPANWTLCLQNNEHTRDYGFSRDVDAATLLAISEHTRHTPDGMEASKDAGQMIFAHTVMKPGARVLLRIALHPYASQLARGAAYFAFRRWLDAGGQVGGREGTGEGHFRLGSLVVRAVGGEEACQEDYETAAAAYEGYVVEHQEQLREVLVSGTLGWRERLKAWGN